MTTALAGIPLAPAPVRPYLMVSGQPLLISAEAIPGTVPEPKYAPPRVQDPGTYRIEIFAGMDSPHTQSTLVFVADRIRPSFLLDATDTAILIPVFAAATPSTFDTTGSGVGSYQIWYRHQPVDGGALQLVQSGVISSQAMSNAPRYVYGGGCGCGGSCGCGGGCGGSCHPPGAGAPKPDDCLVLTSRARVEGTWQGDWDANKVYERWDVVVYEGRKFAYVGKDGGMCTY